MVLNKPILGAPNFTLAELLRSATAEARGIDNTPNEQQAENLRYLAREVLQPIRDHFGVPIRVSSGYRSPELNKAINGSPTSFHSHGMAADIEFADSNDGTLIDIFEFVYDTLSFTELIAEELPNGWIHVAIAKGREKEKQTKYKRTGEPVRRATFKEIIALFKG